MTRKPTYEALEQRVRELEEETAKCKRAEQALHQSERELRTRNRIAGIFLTASDDEIYGEVLQVVLEAMGSKFGTFAYINENGDRVVPSMTRGIWDKCKIRQKDIFFPRKTWGNNLWARCIMEKRAISSNGPFKVPEGHIPITRALAVPIIHYGDVIGNFMVGNKATDYDERDEELLKTIADHTAPILHAWLQRERHEKERKRTVKEIKSLAKFPSENPNPVLRASGDGTVLYANEASSSLLDCWGCQVSQYLPDGYRKFILDVLGSGLSKDIEIECGDRVFSLTFAPVVGGDYVNLYGLDITERKRAEEMLQEAYHELERRVKERTAELTEANEQLRHEMEQRKRVEEDLRRDRSSLAEAQRIAHLGNWDWNIITNELKWSDEIYRIFGLAPQEFGATYEAFLNCVHPDDRQFVMKAVDEALSDDKLYSIDHRIVLGDGTERIVHEEAAITFNTDGKPVRMIGTVHDITDRKLAEEALQKSEIDLRRLSAQLLEVQESERKRIAMELHDSIGQFLVTIKFGLENAINKLPENTAKESVELLKALIPLIQQGSDEVRRIHTDLRPGLLDDLGIIATISWFCREFERLYSGLRIEKQVDIEEREVPEPLKIVIFRVVQEALNNVGKYAKADLVRLSIKRTDSKIELVIEDNGQGFDIEHFRSANKAMGGVGIGSMKERTQLSGGSFSIDSIKGEGTTVRASWQGGVPR